MMTTLSLLPHHHHCSEAICLMPEYCENAHDECAHHEESNSPAEDNHCSLRVLDLSSSKMAERVALDVQQFDLLCPDMQLQLSASEMFVCKELPSDLVRQLSSPYSFTIGLRAPPVC